MRKLLLLALVPVLVLMLALPATAQEDANLINGIPPANGVAYTPEEIQTLNEPLRMCIFTCYPAIMYDPDFGVWYYYYFDTGAWYWVIPLNRRSDLSPKVRILQTGSSELSLFT